MLTHHDAPEDRVDANATQLITAKAPIVMVVGPFGCGVEELAAQLAAGLGLPLYDPHKLDALAREREKHDTAWQHLKNEVGNFFDFWLEHLHGSPGQGRIEHLRNLEAILERVADEGGVIVGVCIHHLLPQQKLFRIKVDASIHYCASRLAHLRHCSQLETTAIVYHMEDEYQQFLDSLFETGDDTPIPYDLLLKAEEQSLEAMVATCLTAIREHHLLEQAA